MTLRALSAALLFGCVGAVSPAPSHAATGGTASAQPCSVPERLRLRAVVATDLPTAQQAEAKLREGVRFEDVLEKYALGDVVRLNGGEQGWTWLSSLPKPLATELAALPIGGYSTPHQSIGYSIYQVEDRAPAMSCGEAMQRFPSDAYAYLVRAALAYARADYAAALPDYAQAIARAPTDEGAYYGRAMTNLALGRRREALDDAQKAIAYNKSDSGPYSLRGWLESSMGDDDLATADGNRAIERDPASWNARWVRGTAYYNLGYLDAALADFNEAARLSSAQADVYDARGLVHFAKGDAGKALADFSRALALKPGRVITFMNRGAVRAATRDDAGARADFERVIGLDPGNAYAPLWLDIIAARTRTPSGLRAAAARLDRKEWPGPLVPFYLGTASLEQAQTAAESGDPLAASTQSCEARLYGGLHLLGGPSKARGRALVQTAAKSCPYREIERWVAAWELRNLAAGRP